MYLGIDIGGTKTLFAVFDESGQVIFMRKVSTQKDFSEFLKSIKSLLNDGLKAYQFSYCCCASPGRINYEKGEVISARNLNWKNIPLKYGLKGLLGTTPVLVHNDAKLAGLSEALLVQKEYKKVLYLTISTGIGGSVITNGIIDPDFINFEPGQTMFSHEGKDQTWEDFASGRALKQRYGQLASEIEDPAIWKEYSSLLVVGLENLLATVQPDAVIFGGGVGAHFEKFQPYLEEAVKSINNPLVPTPPLLKARRPEEAVIYGCYDYIKQNIS